MNESRVYLDTSAYLSLLINRGPCEKIRKTLDDKVSCSSFLLILETERNLVRLSREGALSEDVYANARDNLKKDSSYFELKELSADICLTGIFPSVTVPKSSDLAHLRTAIWFQQNGGLNGFLTLDRAQKQSAIDLGLPVIPLP